MKTFMSFFLGAFLLLSPAYGFETSAKQAILIDQTTGTLLYEKEADALMAPSSMSKILTALLVLEAIQDKQLKLTDRLPVSKEAWQTGGTKMFVKVGDTVSVDDLLRGIIVQSGNDACVVVAEALAGTDAAFGEKMTRRAHELGAKNSTFGNATGLPHPKNLTTARDLAIIAAHILKHHPGSYKAYFAQTEFTYNNIKQANRNPLLTAGIGADGLKTGFTDLGGYGVVASAVENGRRLLMVVNGLASAKERARETKAMMVWGFREFQSYLLFAKGAVAVQSDVWIGSEDKLPLVTAQDIGVTIPRHLRKGMVVKVIYPTPVAPPIQVGQKMGEVTIAIPGRDVIHVPLYAGKAVEKANVFGRISGAMHYLLWGKNR